MSSTNLSLSPVDAWFFRDSRPYNKDEANQAGVRSLFPPHATTVVGALRAGLARENGWNGRSRWTTSLTDVLGDGYDDLGELDFFGPYLMRERDSAHRPLFPAPLSLLGTKAPDAKTGEPVWSPRTLLRPGKAIRCDLGDEVRMPQSALDEDGLKDPNGIWLTTDGLARVLRGEVPGPGECIASKNLWSLEARVGLKRKEDTLTTGDGALYSPSYVRLAPGISLGARVDGMPGAWKTPSRVPLGGESRLANIDAIEQIELPDSPMAAIRESKRMSMTFVTPARFDNDLLINEVKPNQPLPDAFGELAGCTLVSACVGKPVFIGGWNSLERKPLPLEPYWPAGTTLFLEAGPDELDAALETHKQKVGQRTAYGFGQVVVGTW